MDSIQDIFNSFFGGKKDAFILFLILILLIYGTK